MGTMKMEVAGSQERLSVSRRLHIPEELIFIVMTVETSDLTILKHYRFYTMFGISKNI